MLSGGGRAFTLWVQGALFCSGYFLLNATIPQDAHAQSFVSSQLPSSRVGSTRAQLAVLQYWFEGVAAEHLPPVNRSSPAAPVAPPRLEAPKVMLLREASKYSILRTASYARGDGRSSLLDPGAYTLETSYGQQVRVPVAALGGRIELGGYYYYQVAENLLLGLPGAGSLPARGTSVQAHPAIPVPLSSTSVGLSLSLRPKRDSETNRNIELWRCLGRVFSGRRSCRAS